MVSVIIPTYKRAEKLERAIKSVLNQTYKDIEIIVVDDNEPNGDDRKKTEKMINKYLNITNFKYVQHEKNKNGAVARNTGISIAKGEYITFLDDDDYFAKDRINKLVIDLDNNKEYNVAYTSGIVYKDNKVISVFRVNNIGDYKKELLCNHSFIGTGSNIFVRANELKAIGGFNELYNRHQDIEMLIRLLRNNKIMGIAEPLIVKDNSSRNDYHNIENFITTKELFLEDFKEDIETYTDANEIYFENYFSVLQMAVRCNDKKNVKIFKEKIKKYKKNSIKNNLILAKIRLTNNNEKFNKKIKLNLNEKKLLQEFKDAN